MAGVEVHIGAESSDLDTAVKNAKGQLAQLRTELREGMTTMAKYGAAAALAGAAIATGLTVKGLAAVDSQAKLARSLDTSIDSLRALQIAASDSGLDGMEGSLARMNRRLGAAERGSGAAAHAVKALNLDLNALSGMDVDQRVGAIADAIRDSGVSMQQAARHAQDLGFEQREAAAFFMQGGDAIRGYRQEVDDLGLSLSAIDAAQVEAANDSFARFGLRMEGIQQQMAVQFAPILDAISKMMIGAGKDGQTFGITVESAMNKAVDAAAFVLDAAEGIRRVFEVAGKTVAVVALGMVSRLWDVAETIINGPTDAVNGLIGVLNRIPGVDIEQVGLSGLGERIRSEARMAREAVRIGISDIHDTMMEPMPGGQFKRFVDEARQASREAAEALQQAAVGDGEGLSVPSMSEEDKRAAEKRREDLARRIEGVRQANLAELEALREKFAAEQEILNEGLEANLITEEFWAEQQRLLKEREQAELTAIEEREAEQRRRLAEQEARAKQQILSNAFRGLTTLMNSESRKMFEIGKAASIAQAIVATYTGMSEALKLGWPLGPIAASAIGAAGFANVAAIRSQSMGGSGGAGAAASNTGAVNAAQAPTGVQGSQQTTQQFNISLADEGMFSGRQVRNLIGQINEQTSQNGMVLITQGQ